MSALSIVIADDHPIVRRGLRSLLEAQSGWKVVAEAANGREAVAKVEEFHPHIVVLDLAMPQLNGLDAARLILKSAPETRVLLRTDHEAEAVMEAMLAAGVRGYVPKSEQEEELVAAVRALAHGKTYFSSAVSNVLLRRLQQQGQPSEARQRLSLREREIVQLLAEGKSNKQVAAVLGISTRTVENHRANLMKKLGLKSLSDLVRYAIRNNIVEP